ncbi:MAG: hypothetical protein Q8R37_06240, partial [Nanoarchaeota archaeon]|nr:hypothetical protein [Nanoarchaeota archaeon]
MNKSILIKKYFEEKKFVESNIQSFNILMEKGLQEVIEENKEAEPTIIPHNIEKFKIRFGRMTIGKPEITEADGSKRPIYPMEARLRKISYHAPIYLEVSTYINDVQRENFIAEVGKMPIMLKSKHCNLDGLSTQELIKKGEDATDPGGYFIINGTERVIVNVEDLAPNNFMVEKEKDGTCSGRFFAAKGSYKIPHNFERKKDGIYYITFTRVKTMPIIVVLKALGLLKDEEIMKAISTDKNYEEIILNLFEFVDVKTQDDAIDYIAKRIGIAQVREVRMERTQDILDKYLAIADRASINPKMFNSFVDGTKSGIEMTAVCNATGLLPQSDGLRFPPATRFELADICKPKSEGGTLEKEGVTEVTSSVYRDG